GRPELHAEAERIRRAYDRETAGELPRRYALAALLFIFFSGTAALLDRALSPQSGRYVAAFLAFEWLVLALVTLALRRTRRAREARWLAAGAIGLVAATVVAHDLLVPRPAEI